MPKVGGRGLLQQARLSDTPKREEYISIKNDKRVNDKRVKRKSSKIKGR